MYRVLVVDDSAFMRQFFTKIIDKDPDFMVIDTARNGQEALHKIPVTKPDVITLDIEMPIKNGIETLKEITALAQPVPVIMVSSLNEKETVLEALDLGAFDFIPKPSGILPLTIKDISQDLLRKLQEAAAQSTLRKNTLDIHQYHRLPVIDRTGEQFPVIVIGTSTGGPKAIRKILPLFPAGFPGAILIVQHMPPGFTQSLARGLDDKSAMAVREAAEKDRVQPGVALIAPGGFHLEVKRSGRVALNQKPSIWGVRPAVDYLFTSAARVYQESVIGVILTGMGHDGAAGMVSIKQHRGYGIVEDRSTALVYGMPGSTIKENAYDEILPLYKIPDRINQLIVERY